MVADGARDGVVQQPELRGLLPQSTTRQQPHVAPVGNTGSRRQVATFESTSWRGPMFQVGPGAGGWGEGGGWRLLEGGDAMRPRLCL